MSVYEHGLSVYGHLFYEKIHISCPGSVFFMAQRLDNGNK
jgi:hypothetical protein